MQWHSFSTDEWISLRNSPFLWQKIYGCNGVGVWGAPEHPTSWQMLHHLKFELSRPDAFYLMFLILALVKKIYRVFIYGVIFKMIPVHWQRHFIFDRWMDVLREIVSFFVMKNVSHQRCFIEYLRIHAECSAIWSGFWYGLVPDGIKRVQNTMSQRTGFVIL